MVPQIALDTIRGRNFYNLHPLIAVILLLFQAGLLIIILSTSTSSATKSSAASSGLECFFWFQIYWNRHELVVFVCSSRILYSSKKSKNLRQYEE
jgi:hypothetical protein